MMHTGARHQARILPLAITALAAALAIVLSAACAADRGADIAVTVYADAGYPPYAYEKDGKPAGLYYEIVKAAFARMRGYQVTVQPVPWKRGMALLQSGAGFALYPPYMNTRDEPWTWPYSRPLYEEHVVAVCRKDVLAGGARTRWPEDFYGLTIGNNSGFIIGGDAFDQAVRAGRLRMEDARDSATNILKLKLRRIDCYINDRYSIEWTTRQLRAEGRLADGAGQAELVEAAVIAVKNGYLGYTNRDHGRFPFKQDFVRQFDTAIDDLRRSGELDRLVRSYLRLP